MKLETNITIHYYLCALLAFLMPLLPMALPVLIALLVLNRIVYLRFGKVERNAGEKWALFLFTGLYLAYLAGMLYTENTGPGWRDLETKLSLLLLPLLFFFSFPMEKYNYKKILWFFIWGCAVSAVYSSISSIFDYIEGKEGEAKGIPGLWDFGINHWLSSRLTKHFHPSYLSMYVNFAIAALFYVSDWPRKALAPWKIGLAGFLGVYVLFINSKSGLLILLLMVLFYMGYSTFVQRKIAQAVISVAVFAALFSVLWFAAPEFPKKIEETVASLTEKDTSTESNGSSHKRVMLWKTAKEVISEHALTGVGTGDVKAVIMERYLQKQFFEAYVRKLNTHSQFLQTLVAIGIPGFVLLAASLLYPVWLSFRSKHYLHLFFIILIISNFLTEAMLETQAGVIFFAFFNSFMMFNRTGKNNLISGR